MTNKNPMFYVKLFMTTFIVLGFLFTINKSVAKPFDSAPTAAFSSQKKPIVIIHTTQGPIKIELDVEDTPATVQNFLSYAKEGYYNGTLFHRVIDGFMIQGGGFLPGMKEKPVSMPPIKNEGSKCGKNKRGTLAMARTSDPHSATSQFFINVADNDFLDFQSETPQGWGYCAFGHVVEGMDVVDQIKAVPTTTVGVYQDVPANDVLIDSVEIMKD
ncbi:MAG: peptidyl-prolyl cis-trans isomerase [Gammaproteobacteria bacterium]|nr:peptidyl-prolyl cis-trans isomerase [Gammaproteobacteria bacterium]